MSSAVQPMESGMAIASRLANFVIGGTEKSGTTSVFDYLSAHPQVCASSIKETDFFRHGYTGDLAADARRYASYFEHCDSRSLVRLEASPGYLGEAATVAPRLRALVPEAKVLFILRDPVERLLRLLVGELLLRRWVPIWTTRLCFRAAASMACPSTISTLIGFWQ